MRTREPIHENRSQAMKIMRSFKSDSARANDVDNPATLICRRNAETWKRFLSSRLSKQKAEKNKTLFYRPARLSIGESNMHI